MYSSNQLMPPLWIWALLAATCLTLTFILINVANQKEKEEYAVRSEYLAQPLDQNEAHYILFVGSSLTQCSIDSARLLEEALSTETGQKTVVRKFWRRATSTAELFRVLRETKIHRPDILVVEANMFFYSAHDRSVSYKLSIALRELRRGRKVVTYNPEEKPPLSRFDAKTVDGFRGEVVDTTQLKVFCEVASELARQGTKVLLLNFPLERTAESEKWKSADTAIYQRNIQFLKERLPVSEISMKVQLDSTYYIDRGHMNHKGAKVFSNLLQHELAKHIQAP